jgi:hypothetical protein
MVDHRPAVAKDAEALGEERLGDVFANRQAFEAAPHTGLQESVADPDPPGCLQLDGKATGGIARTGRELEVQALPLGALCCDRGFGVSPRAIGTFQGQEHGGRRLCTQPDIAVVALAFDKVHSPSVKALVLDAEFAVPGFKCDALALNADERRVGFERERARR